jgi:glutamate decarboxylase
MTNISNMATFLANCLKGLGFIILSESGMNGVPLVAFRLDPKQGYQFDEFALAHQLRQCNWLVPAYSMAAHVQDVKLLRIVCRCDFSRSLCDTLLKDIRWALETLKKMDRETVRLYAELERLKLVAGANGEILA